jgi:hypothetical protein
MNPARSKRESGTSADLRATRDLCKRQTADADERRQQQVMVAQVALQAIAAHGESGVWTSADCATHAHGALIDLGVLPKAARRLNLPNIETEAPDVG